MARLRNWIELLRANRAIVKEKVTRAKKATLQSENKSLANRLKKIERMLVDVEETIYAANEMLEGMRSIVFEESDMQHIIEKTELPNATGTENSAHANEESA